MNISGILVKTSPAHLPDVKKALPALPGVQIPIEEGDGRLVVIIEESDGRASGEALMKMQNIKGVLSANLFYQYLDEEEVDGRHTA